MRTTITIEGPGLRALEDTLAALRRMVEAATWHNTPQRIALTVREHTFNTYGGPTTATIRIEEGR